MGLGLYPGVLPGVILFLGGAVTADETNTAIIDPAAAHIASLANGKGVFYEGLAAYQ
jgi:hypothetical protein